MCNLHNMCDYTHLGVTQRCVVYTMCVIFTEYVVFAPIHCYAAFTLSVCSFTHFVLFCVFFSFLHKPSDFLHWLCLAQQIYAILSWNSFVVIYAFFGVNFLIQKFCPCKKNDKYEVCRFSFNSRANFMTTYMLFNLAFKEHETHLSNSNLLYFFVSHDNP